MATMALSAVQWSDMKHITEVQPLGDADADFLHEVRDVTARHGNLGRIGIALLHSHFDLADDEMLLETTDAEARTHYVRPVKKTFFDGTAVVAQTTIVGFDEKGYHQNCGCDPRASGHYHK